MIIKSRQYVFGDTRVVRKFAWLPVRVSGTEKVWLEWYYRSQFFMPWDDIGGGYWIDNGNSTTRK